MTARHHIVNTLAVFIAGVAAVAPAAQAAVIVDSQPVASGTMRESHLWIDPGPDGNDSDLDTVCWTDFTIAAPKTIDHLEWWGTGVSEIGFRIEVWPQDPNTIAYQPLGAFYYGGANPPPVPTVMFETNAIATSPGPGGLTHYVLEIAQPFTLAANTTVNPRWFIGVVGLSGQYSAAWKWARGIGGSNKTFRWLHGSGGPVFQSLGEGRALLVSDTSSPCPGDLDGNGLADGADLGLMLGQWGSAGSADLDGNGAVDGADLGMLLGAWGACP
ncbi:MAG: hypothetical protein U0575_06605 [Phycisphaerales bacterium]